MRDLITIMAITLAQMRNLADKRFDIRAGEHTYKNIPYIHRKHKRGKPK